MALLLSSLVFKRVAFVDGVMSGLDGLLLVFLSSCTPLLYLFGLILGARCCGNILHGVGATEIKQDEKKEERDKTEINPGFRFLIPKLECGFHSPRKVENKNELIMLQMF